MNLQQLIEAVRQRSDMENTDFVTDPEITYYINSSATELYDLLVSKGEDYYTPDPIVFNITSGNTFQLPVNFYKLRGVDKDMGAGEYVALENFNFNERNRRNLSVSSRIRSTKAKYRIVGSKLIITPEDDAVGAYRLWYIPQCPKLVNLTDEIDVIFGWEEYVIVDAAIKCLQKEESDVTVLAAQKADLLARIERASTNRDMDQPESITDVYKSRYWYGDI